ncbi:TIGR03435 family protein [Terriglobus sp. TAA 43]|uniref:TIGR03435 family protein n=1 Tax=Terriglobus sp. TAA 43 TaxID=278961 RepID=UPI0006482093|nr:TIGR03435 family protein [Terriglobus sp. TAA 43]
MTFPHRWFGICLLLLSLLTEALQAQTPNGVWQGTLPVDHDARLVLRLDLPVEGAPRGTFQWVDREPAGIAFSSVKLHAGELAAESDVVGVSFHGKLSADGQSLVGAWMQDQKSYSLTLMRTAPEQAWQHGGAAVAAMARTADPAFEVASIRPSAPGTKGHRYDIRTRDFGAHNASLSDLVKFAFQVRARQISGAPAWMDEEKFDITAKPDTPGQPNVDQYRTMVKKLLAERFGFRFHTVQQAFPVYALTLAAPHPGLNKSNPGLNSYGISLKQDPGGDTTQVRFTYETMPEFVDILMNFIEGRQVVDETGLGGAFDFSMVLPSAALDSADSGEKTTAFLRAVQPLGFRLVPKSAPVPVMVIDQVTRPSPN